MNEAEIKERLIIIKGNDFELKPGMDIDLITKEMLKYIGSTDPELRDLLIYQTFYRWILEDKYNAEKLSEIAEIAIDDRHLLYKLGEKGSDSVFTRTFSSLLCALILHADRKRNFLSEDMFHEIKGALYKYLEEENDTRGFVPGKGWAHGIAHVADALEELPYFEYLTDEDLHELLVLIRNKMITNQSIYISLEDERMANAVVTVFKQHCMAKEDIFNWLDSFNNIEADFDWAEGRFAIHNLKLFLKSLYFKVVAAESLEPEIAEKIKDVILKTR